MPASVQVLKGLGFMVGAPLCSLFDFCLERLAPSRWQVKSPAKLAMSLIAV
jgi:hypothetical protein